MSIERSTGKTESVPACRTVAVLSGPAVARCRPSSAVSFGFEPVKTATDRQGFTPPESSENR
ncbi:hypothetical protein BRD01_13680 [Halobacteriales archaeon QS_8_65_32]|nr:MAG: hypothetical protein BRD01_13680 [Halobacteriales archaeon QS_8_65_32]